VDAVYAEDFEINDLVLGAPWREAFDAERLVAQIQDSVFCKTIFNGSIPVAIVLVML